MRSKQNKKKMMIAIILSMIAAFVVYNSSNSNKATIDKLNKTLEEQQQTIKELKNPAAQGDGSILNTKVAVAKQDIKSGTKLTLEMIELKDSDPKTPVQDGISDLSYLAGQTVTEDITKGNQITKSKIYVSFNEKFEIPEGMRAITIPSGSIQGMASYITVGSKIDIVSAQKDNNPEFILQGAKIISFEGVNKPSSDTTGVKFDGITILVPANIVPHLVDAMTNGKLQVVARGFNDNKIIKNHTRINNSTSSQVSSEFTVPPPPGGIKLPAVSDIKSESVLAQSPQKNKEKIVEVIQANVKSEVSFDGN